MNDNARSLRPTHYKHNLDINVNNTSLYIVLSIKEKLYGRELCLEETKEEIWFSPMTKAQHQKKNPKSNVTTQKRHQKFDYTKIADRLRTVSRGNGSHLTGVVKPVYGISTFLLTAKAV